MRVWIDGTENATLALYDRGMQYGDGVFETMRLQHGTIHMWEAHLSRLQSGCQRLNIKLDTEVLRAQMQAITAQLDTGVLKLMVTRGAGGRGYRTDPDTSPTLGWLYTESPDYPSRYYTEGVDVCLCKTLVSRQPLLAGIKHLNRLENVMARQEWQDEFQEGLMCDESGNIIEGTMTNFFAVKGDILMTPSLSHSGVHGIMRQRLLDIAPQFGFKVAIRDIAVGDIQTVDNVLLSNSLIGVWPVRRIADMHYSPSERLRQLVAQLRICQN
ncbi:MAG: aminodeoxychorismate lyase [Gammaproteobacteria bacterium]